MSAAHKLHKCELLCPREERVHPFVYLAAGFQQLLKDGTAARGLLVTDADCLCQVSRVSDFLLCFPDDCGSFFFVQIPGSDAQNPRYVVNIANMVQYIRSNLVKCTVRDRYGKETARIVEVKT